MSLGDSIALSLTGKMIAGILAVELLQTDSAPLTSTTPLDEGNSEPPVVAERLAKIVGGSGLFYESHLADWVAGKRDFARVKAESDERIVTKTTGVITATKFTDRGVVRDSINMSDASGQKRSDAQSMGEPSETSIVQTTSQTPSNGTPSLEDRDAIQLVRQQLNVLATGQIAWQGLVREGVPGEIEIRHEARGGNSDQADVWQARIRINSPTLGEIDVAIALASNHLSLSVVAAPDAQEHLIVSAEAFKLAVRSRGIELGALAIADPNILNKS